MDTKFKEKTANSRQINMSQYGAWRKKIDNCAQIKVLIHGNMRKISKSGIAFIYGEAK